MSVSVSYTPVIVDAGFDYITATSNTQKTNNYFEAVGEQLLANERLLGSDIVAWNYSGYHGMTSGSCQLATNGHSRLLRLSGHLAQKHWHRIAERAANISRADWQVTIRFRVPVPTLAEKCERQARRFEATHNHGRQVELRRNSLKGKTLYVGSHKSDRFLRLYDKGMQSKLEAAGFVWRAEIQYQNKLALLRTTQLLQEGNTEEGLIPIVTAELARVGIVSLVPSATSSLKASSGRLRRETDMRLDWLNSQVKSTVQKLVAANRLFETLDALGLTDLVSPREV